MQKEITLFLICLFLGSFAFAQGKYIDPLSKGVFTVKVKSFSGQKGKTFTKTNRQARIQLANKTAASGFMTNYKGKNYILTCAHAVESAKIQQGEIVARDYWGRTYLLNYIGSDTYYDIAVLEFKEDLVDMSKYRVYNISKRAPKSGQEVVAFGNIEAAERNVNMRGEIESTGQYDGKHGRALYGYYMTNIDFTNGMQGGPLLNLKDEVVGMSSFSIKTKTGEANYHISGQELYKAFTQIVDSRNHQVKRTFCGIVFRQAAPKGSQEASTEPVILYDLVMGTPAYGDLIEKTGAEILKINGTPVNNLQDVNRILSDIEPYSDIELEYIFEENKETMQIQTILLASNVMPLITNHFFKENSSYRLAKDRNKVLVQNKAVKENAPLEVSLASNENLSSGIYLADSKKRMGEVVRRFSVFGGLNVISIGKDNQEHFIENGSRGLPSGYTARIIYH